MTDKQLRKLQRRGLYRPARKEYRGGHGYALTFAYPTKEGAAQGYKPLYTYGNGEWAEVPADGRIP